MAEILHNRICKLSDIVSVKYAIEENLTNGLWFTIKSLEHVPMFVKLSTVYNMTDDDFTSWIAALKG